MRESYFQAEWRASWLHHHPACHYVKIPDTIRTNEARFAPPKPYDCFAIFQGKTYCMELKLMTKLRAFPFKAVTDGQVNNLLEAHQNGAVAFIAINYRIKMTDKQKEKYETKKQHFNHVFIIPIEEFMELDEEISYKSLAFDTLITDSRITNMPRKNKHWHIPLITRSGVL